MEINRDLVEHLANLSRLHFTDEEMEAMRVDLAKMIGFVEKLNELDTTGVAPLMHMSTAQDIYRDDVASEPMDAAAALKNAKSHAEKYFNVPKVIH
jgi:aspartyl-tRNA(Asn)/glutamyl-tRNA(Gln) amidotransferase subunit C